MTQTDKNHNEQTTTTPNQPEDLSSFYRTLAELIALHHNELTVVANPLSLIALVTHTLLISHSFALKTGSALLPEKLILPDHAHSTLLTYSHPQSSLSFEFTLSKIGNRISIAGIAVEDDRLSSLDFSISEYLDPAQFPLTLTKDHQTTSIGLRSTTHLLDLLSLFANRILNHLLPDLIPPTNPNPRPPPTSSSSSTALTSQHRPHQPAPELCERIQVNPQSHQPSPLEIGRSDLDPIGTSNLHLPSLYNAPAGIGGHLGMLVGGDHPMFNRQPQQPGRLGGGGAFGGEFLPPGAVPPGARFDPFGPGVSPAFPRQPGASGADFDPMGGLGQGLPLQTPHRGFAPSRSDFNDFRPPGGPASGYDDMFM
ncbi:uncharacterized protein VP01_2524g4 [Puccinia sorghi]|uniref:Uncharacterized protein n=1 Tax=Puccinia sorghi TaxID=27349 RepID=A0A0L6V5D2_9BASI|nr:uncharacterized protein VP01_2524g4 [Puccinia sorghi]